MESIIRIGEALGVPVSSLFVERSEKRETDSQFNDQTFKNVFQDALHLILITDVDGKILRVNSSVLELSGHREKDLVGNSLFNASLWENYEDSSLLLKKGVQQARWGNLFRERLPVETYDGNKHEATCFVSPVIQNDRKLDNETQNNVGMLIVECYLKELQEDGV